jgi:23S rRNA pseudouridine1911/1915/1917 synthase
MKIKADNFGLRLDVFLSEKLEGRSRSGIQKLLENGGVTKDGAVMRKSHIVSEGDVFDVDLPEETSPEAAAEDIPLHIVYEDGDIIVVDKPRGMVTHPAPGHASGTLVNALKHHCGDNLSTINGSMRPGIVHRLDKDTSGLIVAAKNDAAHASLALQLESHDISRIYEAVARGSFKEDSGTVDLPIGRHKKDRKRFAVTEVNSKRAVTHYEVIARYEGYTHIRCKLETGRTHQIRVHMDAIGHPLLGDLVYGRKKPEKGVSGQCLHARKLILKMPGTGETKEFEAGLPVYFTEVLKKLGNRL